MRLTDVERNYGAIAPTYDRWTDIVFHRLLGLYRWRVRTVDALGDVEGARVLEIGCGTGNNLPLLMPRIGRGGELVAVDYSHGMLERAAQRVRAGGWPNVILLRDDAARLARVAGPFDAVVSVWCLGVVHDLPAALARLLELVRPGGRVAVLDFERARAERGWPRRLYPLYRRLLLATGIDAPEDLDDARLRERWRSGLAQLQAGLDDFTVTRYFHDMGILAHGIRRTAAP